MTFKILKHTADVRIAVEASTIENLFRDALKGLKELVKKNAADEKYQTRRMIHVTSPERTSLLIDFLNEVLTQMHLHREIYDDMRFLKFSESEIEAEIIGVGVGFFDQDVKAVTYHEANVSEHQGIWRTNLVLDI